MTTTLQSIHSEFPGLGGPLALRSIQNIDRSIHVSKSIVTKKLNKSRLARAQSAPLPSIPFVQKTTCTTSSNSSGKRKSSIYNCDKPMTRYNAANKPPLTAKKQKKTPSTKPYVPTLDTSFWNEGWVDDATAATAAKLDEIQSDIEHVWRGVIDDINNALSSIFSGQCEIPPPSLKDVDDEELFGLQFVEDEDDIMAFDYSCDALDVDEQLLQEFADTRATQ